MSMCTCMHTSQRSEDSLGDPFLPFCHVKQAPSPRQMLKGENVKDVKGPWWQNRTEHRGAAAGELLF